MSFEKLSKGTSKPNKSFFIRRTTVSTVVVALAFSFIPNQAFASDQISGAEVNATERPLESGVATSRVTNWLTSPTEMSIINFEESSFDPGILQLEAASRGLDSILSWIVNADGGLIKIDTWPFIEDQIIESPQGAHPSYEQIVNDLKPYPELTLQEVQAGDWKNDDLKLEPLEFARYWLAAIMEGDKPLWQNKQLFTELMSTYYVEGAGGYLYAYNPKEKYLHTDGITYPGESYGACQVLYVPGVDGMNSGIRLPENQLKFYLHASACYDIFVGSTFVSDTHWKEETWKAFGTETQQSLVPIFSDVADVLWSQYDLDW